MSSLLSTEIAHSNRRNLVDLKHEGRKHDPPGEPVENPQMKLVVSELAWQLRIVPATIMPPTVRRTTQTCSAAGFPLHRALLLILLVPPGDP